MEVLEKIDAGRDGGNYSQTFRVKQNEHLQVYKIITKIIGDEKSNVWLSSRNGTNDCCFLQ